MRFGSCRAFGWGLDGPTLPALPNAQQARRSSGLFNPGARERPVPLMAYGAGAALAETHVGPWLSGRASGSRPYRAGKARTCLQSLRNPLGSRLGRDDKIGYARSGCKEKVSRGRKVFSRSRMARNPWDRAGECAGAVALNLAVGARDRAGEGWMAEPGRDGWPSRGLVPGRARGSAGRAPGK